MDMSADRTIRVRRVATLLSLALAATVGCASVPARQTPVAAIVTPPSIDIKVGWILRLEQQRVLRDPDLPPPDAPSATAVPAGGAAAVAAPPEPRFTHALEPDLAALLRDPEAAVRGRAAIAIGRVGVAAGAALLEAALDDPDEGVRANAAFALGLAGSRASIPALQRALEDPSWTVRGRAIEALGLVGDGAAAGAVVAAAAGCADRLAPMLPDDEEWPKAPEIEVCRLALYALVRLQDYDALARVALDAAGRPVSSWWPVAYALQRAGDARALPALRMLAAASGTYTASFALRGLASLQDRDALPLARRLLASPEADVKLRVAAARVIARVGGADDVPVLVDVLGGEPWWSPLGLEVIDVLGALRRPEAFNVLIDGFAAPEPTVRAATLVAAAKVDPDAFLLALSGLARDRDWRVRAALATALGSLPAEVVTPALVDFSTDEDARVHGPALRALAAVAVSDLPERLAVALEADDFGVRETAAELVGEARPADGAVRLAGAYERGLSDTAYGARLAAIDALADYGQTAIPTLRRALADREWPIRLRAAALLARLGVTDAEPERPAPLRRPAAFFESDALLHPPYTPRVFVETRRGVIEIALDLVSAPLTSATFVDQARSGLFNGLFVHRLVPGFVIQTGDPRGDGHGGPGYTQRDELSGTPYLRGTVGMALGGAETGGSQWFITVSPQPHLDAAYTAFGRVVGGWDVLDRLTAGDVIDRVRIWDGVELR